MCQTRDARYRSFSMTDMEAYKRSGISKYRDSYESSIDRRRIMLATFTFRRFISRHKNVQFFKSAFFYVIMQTRNAKYSERKAFLYSYSKLCHDSNSRRRRRGTMSHRRNIHSTWAHTHVVSCKCSLKQVSKYIQCTFKCMSGIFCYYVCSRAAVVENISRENYANKELLKWSMHISCYNDEQIYNILS